MSLFELNSHFLYHEVRYYLNKWISGHREFLRAKIIVIEGFFRWDNMVFNCLSARLHILFDKMPALSSTLPNIDSVG